MGMRCHSCKSAISLNALPGKCCIIEKVKVYVSKGMMNTGEEYVLPGMEIILYMCTTWNITHGFLLWMVNRLKFITDQM